MRARSESPSDRTAMQMELQRLVAEGVAPSPAHTEATVVTPATTHSQGQSLVVTNPAILSASRVQIYHVKKSKAAVNAAIQSVQLAMKAHDALHSALLERAAAVGASVDLYKSQLNFLDSHSRTLDTIVMSIFAPSLIPHNSTTPLTNEGMSSSSPKNSSSGSSDGW